VLFTAALDFTSWDRASVMAVSHAGGAAKLLIKEGGKAKFVEPGFLLFQRESVLLAARFDLERLELSGSPVPVLEGVAGWASSPPQFSVDDHGTLMYMAKSTESERRLVFFDRQGNEEPLGEQTGEFGGPRLSPDGRFVAVGVRDGSTNQITVLELERDILRVFRSSEDVGAPVWSPDGRWLAVPARQQSGESELYRVRSDLSGKLERLTQSERTRFPNDWSPDGLSLLFTERIPPTGEGDVLRLAFDEEGNVKGEAEVIADGPNWQTEACYSPDGQWIAYTSWESGKGEILVRPSDGSATPVRVTTFEGRSPQWSPTEDVIYFRGTESRHLTVCSVKYTVTAGKLVPSAPEIVFTRPDLEQYDSGFDVAADGERFLFAIGADKAASVRREPIIVQNWTKELEELLPK
jgi:sugar lactone lactonase YvrE